MATGWNPRDSADIQSEIKEVTKEINVVEAQVCKAEAAVEQAAQHRNAVSAALRELAKKVKQPDLSQQERVKLVAIQQLCVADLIAAEKELEWLSKKEEQLRKKEEQLRKKEEQLHKKEEQLHEEKLLQDVNLYAPEDANVIDLVHFLSELCCGVLRPDQIRLRYADGSGEELAECAGAGAASTSNYQPELRSLQSYGIHHGSILQLDVLLTEEEAPLYAPPAVGANQGGQPSGHEAAPGEGGGGGGAAAARPAGAAPDGGCPGAGFPEVVLLSGDDDDETGSHSTCGEDADMLSGDEQDDDVRVGLPPRDRGGGGGIGGNGGGAGSDQRRSKHGAGAASTAAPGEVAGEGGPGETPGDSGRRGMPEAAPAQPASSSGRGAGGAGMQADQWRWTQGQRPEQQQKQQPAQQQRQQPAQQRQQEPQPRAEAAVYVGAYGGGGAAGGGGKDGGAGRAAGAAEVRNPLAAGPAYYGHWSLDEMERLADAMDRYGKRWSQIERETGLRDQRALREKWRNIAAAVRQNWTDTRVRVPSYLTTRFNALYEKYGK